MKKCLPGISPWIVCTQKQIKYSSLMRKINRESKMYLIIVLIIFSTIVLYFRRLNYFTRVNTEVKANLCRFKTLLGFNLPLYIRGGSIP